MPIISDPKSAWLLKCSSIDGFLHVFNHFYHNEPSIDRIRLLDEVYDALVRTEKETFSESELASDEERVVPLDCILMQLYCPVVSTPSYSFGKRGCGRRSHLRFDKEDLNVLLRTLAKQGRVLSKGVHRYRAIRKLEADTNQKVSPSPSAPIGTPIPSGSTAIPTASGSTASSAPLQPLSVDTKSNAQTPVSREISMQVVRRLTGEILLCCGDTKNPEVIIDTPETARKGWFSEFLSMYSVTPPCEHVPWFNSMCPLGSKCPATAHESSLVWMTRLIQYWGWIWAQDCKASRRIPEVKRQASWLENIRPAQVDLSRSPFQFPKPKPRVTGLLAWLESARLKSSNNTTHLPPRTSPERCRPICNHAHPLLTAVRGPSSAKQADLSAHTRDPFEDGLLDENLLDENLIDIDDDDWGYQTFIPKRPVQPKTLVSSSKKRRLRRQKLAATTQISVA